jgi:microcompartment protein CcmL/EutN
MERAIGLLEFNSIAKAIEATDAMLKAAETTLYLSKPVCPGKYISLVGGETAAVKNSISVGEKLGGDTVVDVLVIPNIHPHVYKALNATSGVKYLEALGIIETFSCASTIMAADVAAKTAAVILMEIRLANGLGGKSFVTMTGEVAAVRASVESGATEASKKGLLVNKVIIPAPRQELKEFLL